jgi:colanic acid biosynthesis glycosyl transferase WcaI
MRLLFLNRSFWPDPEATGQFLAELCEDLSAEHEITFVAGPSYHVATKVRGVWRRELLGKIAIIRTWGTRLPKTRLPARLVNLGSYYLLAALAALRVNRPDIIVAETDPPLLGALGVMLKRLWGCRLLYNVRDLYPDIAEATGGVKSRALLKLLEVSNSLTYAWADLIVVLGQDMAERVIAKGVPPEKVVVVPDWVDTQQIRPLAPNPFRAEFPDKFIIMYSGNLGLSQQLESVLEAARRLHFDQQFLFVLIGEGARKQWLQDQAARMSLTNVRFLPYQPKENLAESLSGADLHLVPMIRGAAGCMVPSKIYGIMAAGRPFVAMMEERAEVARFASEFQIGFVIKPGDSEALASTILAAAANREGLASMGQRARRLAEQHFDRRVVTARFAETLTTMGATNPHIYSSH